MRKNLFFKGPTHSVERNHHRGGQAWDGPWSSDEKAEGWWSGSEGTGCGPGLWAWRRNYRIGWRGSEEIQILAAHGMWRGREKKTTGWKVGSFIRGWLSQLGEKAWLFVTMLWDPKVDSQVEWLGDGQMSRWLWACIESGVDLETWESLANKWQFIP